MARRKRRPPEPEPPDEWLAEARAMLSPTIDEMSPDQLDAAWAAAQLMPPLVRDRLRARIDRIRADRPRPPFLAPP